MGCEKCGEIFLYERCIYAEYKRDLTKEELENDSDYLESGGSELLDED